LTRPFDKHLDRDELERLVSLQRTGLSDSARLSDQSLSEAERHVESCPDCSRQVQMHQSVHSEILRMRGPNPSPLTPECIEDAEWLEVAAGLYPEAKTIELMKHAAQCGHCGPLLKNTAEALVDEATPSEEAWLSSLRSARPEWRKNMAATLRASTGAKDSSREKKESMHWRQALLSWPRPAFALAGIAVAILSGWFGSRMLRPLSAEQLLAQAYTEHRTLEVRIRGAGYAPMRVERSTGRSNLDKSPSLLKAEALIGENLRKNPNDPQWLQARARADLLDGNYESAIKSLQRALETQPDDPSLLTDLGSAYFARAEAAARPIDYGNAIESLGKALAKSPDDPIALFNRALACESIFLYTQAVDDWEHYLRVDPQGDWADEARRQLAVAKQKLEQREKSLSEPLLKPEEIAKAGPNDASIREKIDGRIEEYLRVAITDWLPKAFPEPSGRPSLDARTALSELAIITRHNHDDTWLMDLLSGPTAGQFTSAVEALAASLHANEKGDYVAEQNSAHKAALLFRVAANNAGELRAQAEEAYSDHLLWEGPRCLVLLNSMAQELARRSYTWIEAQMSLERSNCADAVGDLGTYQNAIGRGLKEAEDHKYLALYLRALGFQALSFASLGDSNAGFSLASKGLRLFWSNHVDLMKGYNLYHDLDAAADGLRLPNLQVALWREATALLDQHPNLLLRAMAHRWYGNAAYLANLPTLAAEQLSQASALFASSPQTAATARDRMDAEVYLANAEIRQGEVERAAARLQAIKPTLDSAPSFDPEIGFYSAQADLAIRRADSSSAESALRSAVFLGEWALTSYRSENNRRQWAEQTRNAYRDAVEWKLRQGDTSSALELWEWYRGAELRTSDPAFPHPTANLGTDNPPDPNDAPPLPSPTVVASRLPLLRDETVIAYGTFPEGIAIWVYDDRGIYPKWVPTSLAPVRELALRFGRLCSDPTSDLVTLRTTARLLYDLLIAPVENRLVLGRTIVFEPDDVLAAVPWDALVDRGAHYLAERATIVVAPGLYRAMHLRLASPITEASPALVVSVPVAAEEGFSPLADAEKEAQTVAERFPSSRWLQGTDATLPAIRRELRGARVFHFAGHAIASPQRSGLVLAELDPGTQHSRVIGARSLQSGETGALQLTVLSACHSEGEAQVDSSGTETLTESLLRAGVPHVVATRWNVDSRETAEFMKQFYTNLLAGNGVADALHGAQLMLASQPASAHPYYWAAFELQGIR
jgi:CHAT domain-containing protein/tetratricopeptide (TPR) repeat protein